MSTTFFFVILAVVLLVVFFALAARRSRNSLEIAQALTAVQSLDAEAFRNLVDREEEDFLRAQLTTTAFRKIKQERARAALAYVKALSGASVQIAQFAGQAQRSPDSTLAESGRQIANSATNLRLRALDATVQLTLSATFPRFSPRPLRSLAEDYDHAGYLLQKHNNLVRVRAQAS